MKRIATSGLLALALVSTPSQAQESHFKTRIYKDFIRDVFSTNMPIFFKNVLRQQVRDVKVPAIRSKMTNVRLTITPKNGDYGHLDLDMFMEDGIILFEMHDLEFKGDAQIHDPDTGNKERVEFSGPYEVARVVYRP
jgi:hypothetical protein